MGKKFGIASGAFALFLAALWVSANLWLQFRGPDWLTRTIESKAHLDVSIGKVRTNFVNVLRLEDVTLGPPARAKAQRISIAFLPWNALPFQPASAPLISARLEGFE